MKLKTRLVYTCLAIILIPLILIACAYCVIGYTITANGEGNYGIINPSVRLFNDEAKEYVQMSTSIMQEIHDELEENPLLLEQEEYLAVLADRVVDDSSYLIVRKGNEIYYTNNEAAAQSIFPILTPFGADNSNLDSCYYYASIQKTVKQVDFTFSDGENGSLFIVTKLSNLISFRFLKDMFLATIIIMVLTGVLLTRWIHVGVFGPIRDLNNAMKSIAEGNLDYVIETNTKGEIGELYTNYEDMRLRLKESAEEKMDVESKNKELISNISHDLKTPITAVKGYVEGIMDGVADTPEKMDKYIRTIYNKANDMDKLINELTVYSGIDTNRIPYHFKKINVADYFNDCVEEVGLDLESKGIKLHYSNLVDANVMIIADPEQLKRVINNIVGNSEKYMDKKDGELEIRLLDEVDSIRVEIEDNGKGIATKDLGKIFERFYRTDASRNSSKGGSGIGLSIVKKIIEDHGGYIWATSKEKEGTCMHFVIRKYQPFDQE